MMSGCCTKASLLRYGLRSLQQNNSRTLPVAPLSSSSDGGRRTDRHITTIPVTQHRAQQQQASMMHTCTTHQHFLPYRHQLLLSNDMPCIGPFLNSDVPCISAHSFSTTTSTSSSSIRSRGGCGADGTREVSEDPVRDVRHAVSGQPTPYTHPHLLQGDEVTVGITVEEYRERRAALMCLLQQQEGEHHVLILPATPRRYMVDKIPYLYRQDTDLLWCSGCQESDCVLVLHTVPGTSGGAEAPYRAVMFCPQHPTLQEIWDGPRTHHYHAAAVWGVDTGFPMDELTNYLSGLEKSLHSPTLWYPNRDPPNPSTHRLLQGWLAEGRAGGLENPRQHLHRARLIKSPAEQALMRQTCRISCEALRSTIAWAEPGMSERQVFAKMDYESRVRGADHLAYPPVVAGGNRANIIHYISNNQIIDDGDLLLMDAGAEYHGYSGDVSRTWPINGVYSCAQRELYEAVLHVQTCVLALLRDSRPSLDQLYRAMCSQLASVLVELAIVPKESTDQQRIKVAQSLCPHHVSHYLGMDVHDTPSIPRSEPLQPGTVITVEPGVYIPAGCRLAPSRYHGLGIRIEDDVLITDTGFQLLTDGCPKHPDDIQQLVRQHRGTHREG